MPNPQERETFRPPLVVNWQYRSQADFPDEPRKDRPAVPRPSGTCRRSRDRSPLRPSAVVTAARIQPDRPDRGVEPHRPPQRDHHVGLDLRAVGVTHVRQSNRGQQYGIGLQTALVRQPDACLAVEACPRFVQRPLFLTTRGHRVVEDMRQDFFKSDARIPALKPTVCAAKEFLASSIRR